jgi:hypothetical protein
MQGDGRHVEIVVVSKEFEGKSAVNRQRMVYKVRTAACAAVCCMWVCEGRGLVSSAQMMRGAMHSNHAQRLLSVFRVTASTEGAWLSAAWIPRASAPLAAAPHPPRGFRSCARRPFGRSCKKQCTLWTLWSPRRQRRWAAERRTHITTGWLASSLHGWLHTLPSADGSAPRVANLPA